MRQEESSISGRVIKEILSKDRREKLITEEVRVWPGKDLGQKLLGCTNKDPEA